jgi:tetratricopeptide (TPR) repeat protein
MVETTVDLNATLREAIAAHQSGRLAEAAALYRTIHDALPDHFEILNCLAAVEAQQGAFGEAERLSRRAVTINPRSAPAHLTRGNILQSLGRLEEALAAYDQALALMPALAEAHSNRGAVLKKLARLDQALTAYDQALALRPDYVDALSNRGVVLRELKRLDEALASYDRALAIAPRDAEVLTNRGALLRELGRADEALASHERALVLEPESATAARNRFKALQSGLGDTDAILAAARVSAHHRVREKYPADPERHPLLISRYRLKHDLEQTAYLIANGHEFDGVRAAHAALAQLAGALPRDGDGPVTLSSEDAALLAPFNQALYAPEPPALRHCLHPNTDWAAIEAEYFSRQPELVVFDNFLSEPCLRALREFCLASTIWKTDYVHGYVGAFSSEGFISALHLNIAHELRQKMPRIFGGLGLEYLWAFKYDSQLGRGINIHADPAKVNLNFWITPDDAVLDPNSGGMKVYDVPSPSDWPFLKYNHNDQAPAIYEFLTRHGAQCRTVPYRCNRAVLFNSALFHETDEIHFKEGYENRRINMTYLFDR